MNGQYSMIDEIIVDSFAGGGGASTGIELATGRIVDIAINHDENAIRMHRTNHPFTEHYQASVWDIDPEIICRGRPVGLAWFSPDCKHFSKAKGAALVDRNIRGLAWIVLRWAGKVRPRVIILENVEEFVTWGPVRKGKPVRKKAGETFRKWKAQLTALGYAIEHRELVAADYGAPTIRKRLVLIARCDGEPIVWPERTHAPADSEEVKSGKCRPWRSAAEIIDWSQPMFSIFDTKEQIRQKYGVNAVRPLAENTLRRIIRGVDKFTLKSEKPFIVECNHSGGGHIFDVDKPHGTITAKNTSGVCTSLFAPVTFSNTNGSIGFPADKPVHTVTTDGKQILSCAQLIQYHTEQSENVRAKGVSEPILTIDASNRHGLTEVHLTEYFGNGVPISVEAPMHTVTSHDREALVAVHIDKYFAGGYSGCGNGADEPLTTVTAEPRHSLTAVHVSKYFSGVDGADAKAPLPTVTAVDHNSLCAAHVAEFKGQDKGQPADQPLRTVTAGGGEFGICKLCAERLKNGNGTGHWPEIRALLNRYCGYKMADDEILLLRIGEGWFFLSDILLRMLTPRELYAAMGFPRDYEIETDGAGVAFSKKDQVARCGNAVCPQMAEAVVRANYAAHPVRLCTMAQVAETVAG